MPLPQAATSLSPPLSPFPLSPSLFSTLRPSAFPPINKVTYCRVLPENLLDCCCWTHSLSPSLLTRRSVTSRSTSIHPSTPLEQRGSSRPLGTGTTPLTSLRHHSLSSAPPLCPPVLEYALAPHCLAPNPTEPTPSPSQPQHG